jgi:hypothetical protein
VKDKLSVSIVWTELGRLTCTGLMR